MIAIPIVAFGLFFAFVGGVFYGKKNPEERPAVICTTAWDSHLGRATCRCEPPAP